MDNAFKKVQTLGHVWITWNLDKHKMLWFHSSLVLTTSYLCIKEWTHSFRENLPAFEGEELSKSLAKLNAGNYLPFYKLGVAFI